MVRPRNGSGGCLDQDQLPLPPKSVPKIPRTTSWPRREVASRPPQRRGVGFVFQHYAPFKHMTVWDNVAFGLQIRRRPKAEISKRVDELLELVQLAGLGKRYPAQLSGGQRQRMALARALAPEPEVLLLDEPFGALDAITRAELQEWLADALAAEPRTVLLVTHDVEEALLLCERVLVLAAGRVVAELDVDVARNAPRREVITSPAFLELRERALEAIG